MPQIANQDYQVTGKTDKGKIYLDDRRMAEIAYAIERGTIFDLVIDINFDTQKAKKLSRVLGVYETPGEQIDVFYIDENTQIAGISIEKTGIQYTVLADIADGGGVSALTYDEDGYLLEDSGKFICADGKYIAVTLDDNDIIASYEITNVEAVGVDIINIPIEDAPGLIGLFAGN